MQTSTFREMASNDGSTVEDGPQRESPFSQLFEEFPVPEEKIVPVMAAAKQGDARAQIIVGMMYHDGHGVPQDYLQAMEWYLKAANQGHADGNNKVGYLYHEGEGVNQDYHQAMEWYQKAANQGFETAKKDLVIVYKLANSTCNVM